MTAADLKAELQQYADQKLAEREASFFKTYDGGYGAGDQFLGLKVPVVRQVAKQFNALDLHELEQLLESPIHEHRLAALFIIVGQAKKAADAQRQALYELYMRRTDRVNNWDLVDASASEIVGGYLLSRPRDILYKLAKSNNLWERRIATIATFAFLRTKQCEDTLALSELLLHDREDLIHKAVGWALREVGKRDRGLLVSFLDKHAHEMPRTMLRYAIEHFAPADRQHYLALKKHNGQSASSSYSAPCSL